MKKRIDFQGQAIHYTDQGKGSALVLLHGFMESTAMWDDFAPALAADFRVICIDLPGHGQSPVYQGQLSMEIMADWVKAVLNGLEVSRCTLVGHSMGGYVSLAFADRYPEMLSGFCLFHSHASSDTAEAKENRRRTINIVNLNKGGFILNFIPDLFAPDNIDKYQQKIEKMQAQASLMPAEAIVAALEAMRDRSGKIEFLLNTRLPVLFIVGKEDARIPVQKVMAQAILPPHAEVLILAGVGHVGFVEARQKTLEMIRSFAQRVQFN